MAIQVKQSTILRHKALELRKKGMSLSDIGRELGVSRQRIHQIIGRDKERRYWRPDIVEWSKEELRRLKTDLPADIARDKGVSISSVYAMKKKLGIPNTLGLKDKRFVYDLKELKFDNMEVIGITGEKQTWLCKCKCGKEFTMKAPYLRLALKSKTCGCIPTPRKKSKRYHTKKVL